MIFQDNKFISVKIMFFISNQEQGSKLLFFRFVESTGNQIGKPHRT